jgi:hypothetical protein
MHTKLSPEYMEKTALGGREVNMRTPLVCVRKTQDAMLWARFIGLSIGNR